MTQLFFMSAFAMGLGYFLGKSFKGLNPFILLFAFIPILAMSSAFLLEQNSNIYTGFFILGFIYNYGNPVRRVFDSVSDAWAHYRYRKMVRDEEAMNESIESEVNHQIHEAHEQLRKQEQEALNRVQREAEKLRRQEQEAMERVKREAEELRRQKAAFEREKRGNKEAKANKSNQESIQDALRVLGLKPGFTNQELKKAYKRESMKYHPDRGIGQPEHIKKLMELKFKEVVSAYNYLEGIC